MKTYQLQLINCNNHNIEISRYLQILTRIEKEDADQDSIECPGGTL